MEYFLTVLGLLCFVEGLPYFAFPDAVKRWLVQLIGMPAERLRIVGACLMLVGLLLVYWGRRQGG
jgi:hypothetical protein